VIYIYICVYDSSAYSLFMRRNLVRLTITKNTFLEIVKLSHCPVVPLHAKQAHVLEGGAWSTPLPGLLNAREREPVPTAG
jgi:hypothetical protein